MGTVCKGTAIVLFILDFIAAIFLSLDLGFLMFLYVVIGGFLFCLFLYATGEIIDQLETSNTNTYELYQLIKNMQDKEEKKNEKAERDTQSAKSNITITSHKWLCNSCGKYRETSPCPYCGKD